MRIGRYNVRIRGNIIKINEIHDYPETDLELEIADFRVSWLYGVLSRE